MAIEQRVFGNTELRVGVLGIGTAEIGFSETPDSVLDSILGMAADAGINVLDSAAMYGNAEEKLGRLLRGRRNDFLIFTKCGMHLPKLTGFARLVRRARRSVRGVFGLPPLEWAPKTLQWNIDESLRRLKTDRLDLIQLHSCSEELLKREEIVRVLQISQDAGKVRYLGYSGDGSAAQWAAKSGLFQAIQTSVNVADQQAIDDVIPMALARRLGIIAKRPIANAIWRSAERPPDPHMHAYWQRLNILNYPFATKPDAVATALRFTLRTGVHTAIIGTTSLQHMRSNIAACQISAADDQQYKAVRARWREVAGPDWIGQT